MTKQLVAIALLTGDVLTKLIGAIGKANASLTQKIQDAATQCVGQSIVHRNASPAMQLFDALGTNQRRDALVAFFEKYGNLTWSKAEKRVIFIDMEKIPNGRKLEWTAEYSNEVANSMWMKAKAEPQPKSMFDVDEETSKFLDRLHKAAKKGAELKHKGLLERLENVYRQYVGEQYLATTTALPTAADVKSTRKKASKKKLTDLQAKFGGIPTGVPGGEKVAA